MKVVYLKEFLTELEELTRGQPRIAARIHRLVKDILAHPSSGIGKPEPLRHGHSGCWSRRIDRGNRILYCPTVEEITFISCRGHYDDC
jgi:toxin YoeB